MSTTISRLFGLFNPQTDEWRGVKVNSDGELVTAGGGGGGGSGITQSEVTAAIQATSLDESLGLSSDAPATSNTGTFGIIALIKRAIAHLLAPRTYTTLSNSASGDTTIVAAPSANALRITAIRIQSISATPTTIIIRAGATAIARLRTTGDGAGISEVYSFSDAIQLPAATALIANQSGAVEHHYSIVSYEVNTGGLPT